MVTYHDDTAVVFFGKTWKDTQVNVELGIQTISNWLQLIFLTLKHWKNQSYKFFCVKAIFFLIHVEPETALVLGAENLSVPFK